MELIGADSTTFQLDLDGYQYPEVTNQAYDSDWLFVTIRVDERRGRWSSTQPILLTWEVARLADWLEAIADGQPQRRDGRPVSAGVSFLEPNLRFAVIDGRETGVPIRIVFEHESRPPWDPSRFGLTDTDVATIDLHLTAEDLRQAAADLRQQLQRFPLRIGR